MRMRIVAICIFVASLLAFGVWLGLELAALPRLATYKLLNVVGTVYGLLGLVVLSELVAANDRVKEFMVMWVSGAVLWATSVVPLGGLVGTVIGHSLPSASQAGKFFGTFFAYSLLVLVFLEHAVTLPTNLLSLNLTKRHQLLGLLLLLSGALAQVVAALQDLNA